MYPHKTNIQVDWSLSIFDSHYKESHQRNQLIHAYCKHTKFERLLSILDFHDFLQKNKRDKVAEIISDSHQEDHHNTHSDNHTYDIEVGQSRIYFLKQCNILQIHLYWYYADIDIYVL